MLVVISIIGILMSLLVPAAMRAREQGRIVQCANHLKQLGFAMLNYETTFKSYPLNWGWSSKDGVASSTIGHSWITLLLPQLDMMPAYQRIQMGGPLNAYSAENNIVAYDNSQVARMSIPFLRCPSDIGDGTALTVNVDTTAGQKLVPASSGGQEGDASEVGVTNYKACAGSNYPYVQNWSTGSGSTAVTGGIMRGRNLKKPSTAPAGTDARDYCNGIMCRGYNPTRTSVSDPVSVKSKEMYFPTDSGSLVDGASYTIAIGEAVPSASPWSAWYWWNGTVASTGLISTSASSSSYHNYTKSRGTAYASPLNFGVNYARTNTVAEAESFGFNSRHGGMVQFVMCDGAVHPISEGVEIAVLNRLAAIDDRELIDNKSLGW
jgi:prepilin-type processing-associated H-X9-DG protein